MATTERPAHGPTRLRNHDLGRPGFWRARSFALVTGALFLLAWSGQFIAQLVVERNEAAQHGEPFQMADFWPQFLASTMENWQSEFLQLVWQAVGLALLLFWGSSQSREGEDRIEAKVDRLLEANGIDPDDVTRTVNEQI